MTSRNTARLRSRFRLRFASADPERKPGASRSAGKRFAAGGRRPLPFYKFLPCKLSNCRGELLGGTINNQTNHKEDRMRTMQCLLLIVFTCFTLTSAQESGTKKSTSGKTKDFLEKQAYKQAIGTAVGKAVGRTAGGVVGGVAAPTRTVDQKTEMKQRKELIKKNTMDHGSPYYRPENKSAGKGKAVIAKWSLVQSRAT